MIIAIVIGRDGSRGFPLKNTHKIDGMPLMAYPIEAAQRSKNVDKVYFSTESKKLKYIAEDYGAIVIDRPKRLSTDEALSDDVWKHAFDWIQKEDLYEPVVFYLLLFANAIGINSWMIDDMIEKLRKVPAADSICTVSPYPTFTPYRMRKVSPLGYLVPFIDDLKWDEISCDRETGGVPYIYDCCCCVVKPKCIIEMEDGLPPQKWLGQNILPYENLSPLFDIDYEFQLPMLKHWVNAHWF